MLGIVFAATWEMILLSAPGLLLGFGLAGVLHVLLPSSLIQHHLRRPGFTSTVKASAFGLPLPLCSCSVIPVGVALRRGGASRGATASFMISTPEIGVDSFILSYFLLGPFLAVMRTVAAFFSALTVGTAIDAFGDQEPPQKSRLNVLGEVSDGRSFVNGREKLRGALRYAYVELFDDLAVVLMTGLLGAGIISALFPDQSFASLGLGILASILLMLFVSLPLYVCATSSTPLALAFLEKGVPLGAVLTFMLAGPASNITTMLAVKKELGGKALAIYIGGLAICSALFGLFAQLLSTPLLAYSPLPHHTHNQHTAVDFALAALFSLLLILAFCRRVLKTPLRPDKGQ